MSLADKFNLLNEFNILRIICAVSIPHIVGKITVPATLVRQGRLQAARNLDVHRGRD